MIASLRQSVHELGAREALWYALARLLLVLGCRLQRYHFVAQRVLAHPVRRKHGTLAVLPLLAVEQLPDAYPRPRRVLAQRFAQGGVSLAAWRGAELAGFLWFQFHLYREDEVRALYRLPCPASAWDYDVYVAPAQRLGAAFSRLWEEAHRRLRARGVRWTCSRISAFNPGSLRAHRRLGAMTLGTASFFTAGPCQFMLASVPPFVHWSASKASMPKLVFDTSRLR